MTESDVEVARVKAWLALHSWQPKQRTLRTSLLKKLYVQLKTRLGGLSLPGTGAGMISQSQPAQGNGNPTSWEPFLVISGTLVHVSSLYALLSHPATASAKVLWLQCSSTGECPQPSILRLSSPPTLPPSLIQKPSQKSLNGSAGR